MDITIIGANSYIARNLIANLDVKKNRLFLYDKDDFHKDGNLNYKKIDILNYGDLEKINYQSEIIYLFAGITGTAVGFSKFESFIDINEKALLKILDMYVKKKSKAKIVFPSSRLVYKGKEDTLKEDSEKEFKTLYAMNKFSCENYLKMYSDMFGLSYCIFRICVPYATRVENVSSYGTVEFFLSMAKKGEEIIIYGNGEQRRTFVHIDDLCEVLWLGAINKKCSNDIFNVGGGDVMSIKEVANCVANVYKVKIKSIQWPQEALLLESGSTVFDSSKLDSIIGKVYKRNILEWTKELKGV